MQSVVEVFGSALASYYNGNISSQIIVREGGGSLTIQTGDFFRSPDDVAIDKAALSYCGERVLNLGARSGEHSLYLIAKGHHVISLDNSPVACAIMHQRGVPAVVCGSILEQCELVEQANTWLALRSVIGGLGNIRYFDAFLELAKRCLLAKGSIVIGSVNLRYEGYRTRLLRYEFEGRVSEEVAWFDIGISSLQKLAQLHHFEFKLIYSDDTDHYLALLTKPD